MNTFYKSLIIVIFMMTVITTAPYLTQAASGFLDTVAATLGLHVEGNAGIEDNLYVGEKLGVGTVNPAESLDVIGKIKTSDGIVFGDGSMQSAAYDGKPSMIAGNFIAGENVQKGDVVRLGANGTTTYNKTISQMSVTSINWGFSIKQGQSFKLGSGNNVNEISVWLKKYGNLQGNLSMDIVALDTMDIVETSSNTYSNFSSSSFDKYSFQFSENTLDPNTWYVFILNLSNGDNNNYLGTQINYNSTSGSLYHYNSSTNQLNPLTSYDFKFEIIVQDKVSEDKEHIYKASTQQPYMMNSIGVVLDNYNLGDSASVALSGLVNSYSNLIPNQVYYLSTTPGSITEVKPTTNAVKVGLSISPTTLILRQFDWMNN